MTSTSTPVRLGPSSAGLPRSVYNHTGYQYRETPGREGIICPGLRCMYNCGVVNVRTDGVCPREDLMRAQQACGMESPLTNVESTEGAKPNLNVLRLLDSPTQVRKTASWTFHSCIPMGMHGPTCIFLANPTPFWLKPRVRSLEPR